MKLFVPVLTGFVHFAAFEIVGSLRNITIFDITRYDSISLSKISFLFGFHSNYKSNTTSSIDIFQA